MIQRCLRTVLLTLSIVAAAPVGAVESAEPGWARTLEPRLAALASLAGVDKSAYWASRPTERVALPAGDDRQEPDVTKAIQGALDRMTGGGTVVVSPGRYRQSDCIYLRHSRIRLVGEGVRLHAVNKDRMCLLIQADDCEITGFELTAEPTDRGQKAETTRIVVRQKRNRVVRNTINGATGAGILVEFAEDFVVADNVVTRTLADGIHVTGGSRRGVVARNRMDLTGDDGIGIVAYRYQPRPVVEVLVEDNAITNVSWARGIAVVGTSDILIRRNRIVGTGRAAGIIVTREKSYDTYGVRNVIVRENHVEKVAQAFDWPYKEKTGQGSIDINAHDAPTPDLEVRQVLVVGNTVVDGMFAGIRMLGGVCEVALLGNRLTGSGKRSIESVIPRCEPVLTVCRGNVTAAGAVPRPCS